GGGGGRSEARDRREMLPALQAAADDPLLRNALPTILAHLDRTYDGRAKAWTWGGAHFALMREGTRDGEGRWAPVRYPLADRLVNRFCLLFIRTYPGVMLDQARLQLSKYEEFAGGRRGELPFLEDMFQFTCLEYILNYRLFSLSYLQHGPVPPSLAPLQASALMQKADLSATEEYLARLVRRYYTPWCRGLFLAGAVLLLLAVGAAAGRLRLREAFWVFAA